MLWCSYFVWNVKKYLNSPCEMNLLKLPITLKYKMKTKLLLNIKYTCQNTPLRIEPLNAGWPCHWRALKRTNVRELPSWKQCSLLLANFCQNSTWKIWSWPIQSIFHEKNDPNSPYFKNKNKNPDCLIFMISSNR